MDSRRVEERELRFQGFRYTCRVVHQQHPSLPPLLILGGSSQDRNSWVRHERWLAAKSTVVTVDLPGYGDSDALPVRYGMDFLAAAVAHTLHELDMRQVNLVGACFGGAISVRVAQHYPALVNRLILVGMAHRVPDDYTECVERWTRMVADGERRQVADELVRRFVTKPATGRVRKQEAVTRFLYRQFVEQSEREMKLWADHNARLATHEWFTAEPLPDVPLLVTTGEHDHLALPADGRVVAERFASALFTTIREADHLAPVERMEEFATLVSRFCASQPLDDLVFCNEVERLGGVGVGAGS